MHTIMAVGALGGDGGLIAIGPDGKPAFAINDIGMYRGRISSDRAAETAIYPDEKIGELMAGAPLRLDETDERLLALLRHDGRRPIAQLAKDLGISRGLLYSRLARLEDEGVVAGYTVRLGEAFAGRRVRAHMMIKTLPRCHREVELALAAIPMVQAVFAISGEYDIIAMLEAEDGPAAQRSDRQHRPARRGRADDHFGDLGDQAGAVRARRLRTIKPFSYIDPRLP